VCEYCAEDFDEDDFDNDRGCATYLFKWGRVNEKIFQKQQLERGSANFL
jgi:hypothetical protein